VLPSVMLRDEKCFTQAVRLFMADHGVRKRWFSRELFCSPFATWCCWVLTESEHSLAWPNVDAGVT
jgi:hypothetical protein